MKIRPEHLDQLRRAVLPLDTPERRDRYRRGEFPRADRVSDIDVRYRWDLLHEALGTTWCSRLYEYLNDQHIDTALRSFIIGIGPK